MPSATWLLHVDRQAWPLALASWRPFTPRAEAEHGENFRVCAFDRQVTAGELARAGLARWLQPVDERTPTGALRTAPGAAAAAARWGARAAAAGCKHALVYQLRRHAAAPAALLAEALGRLLGPGAEAGADEPLLTVAVGDDETLLGLTTRRAAGSPWPGGLPPELAGDAPSRARWKLREALAWAALAEPGAPEPARWLELGAYPGGMTAELVARGARVVAVDLAAVPPELAARIAPSRGSQAGPAQVRWHRADATAFSPEETFDGLLCNMNGTPSSAARAVARLAPWLEPGALVVHTLKLPHWEDLPTVRRKVEAIFADAGLAPFGCRHLAYNRQEVTILARAQRRAAPQT